MTTWVIGLICNAIIAVVYMLIALAIIVPLAKSRQLRTNPLGAATAAIFFTCSVHHGAHSVHMLLPAFGLDEVQGLAMRTAWGWPLAIWDIIGALVGIYYWTLRRTYSSLMQGAKLFEDMRQREQQALEINDNVLQGLVVAKMALDLGEPDEGRPRAQLRDRLGQPDDHRPARQRALRHQHAPQRSGRDRPRPTTYPCPTGRRAAG